MKVFYRSLAFVLVLTVFLAPTAALAGDGSVLNRLSTVTQIASTVPANGDVNPYGIVIVPRTVGSLVKNHILVSNFNNSANAQGTGTTIDEISTTGAVSLFAQIDPASLPGSCPGGVGLTTALAVFRSGWVIVGSLPTSDGTSATAQAGCLLVLNSHGKVIETISGGLINGPWDMTWMDMGNEAVLFVTNVLNGTVAASPNTVNQGTVVRITLRLPEDGNGMPKVKSMQVIGSGFAEKTDPNALVIGPTGVGLSSNGTLFVNDTVNSQITAIPNAMNRKTSAGTGRTVSSGGALNGPLGMTIAPNGNIIVANGGDGNLVEVTPGGDQVSTKTVDSSGAGALFGLVAGKGGRAVFFVDDALNTLEVLH